MGLHYGILILFKFVDSRYPGKEAIIVNWWKHVTVPKFLVRVVLIIPFLLVLLLYLLVPAKNLDYIALIYTFKFALPYLSTGLLIGSAYFLTCIKLKLISIDETDCTKKNEDQEKNEISKQSNNDENNNNSQSNPNEIILVKGNKKKNYLLNVDLFKYLNFW